MLLRMGGGSKLLGVPERKLKKVLAWMGIMGIMGSVRRRREGHIYGKDIKEMEYARGRIP